jgi:xylono-1,5-lactonase
MTADDEGMLWIALGRAGTVHRYRADGTLDGMIEFPATNPTSVAFGGTGRGDPYITTSWFGCEPDSRAAQPRQARSSAAAPG